MQLFFSVESHSDFYIKRNHCASLFGMASIGYHYEVLKVCNI